MRCPVCQKEPAIIHSIYGPLPGKKCQKRRDSFDLPDTQIEFTSEKIKRDRKEFGKSIIQPYRGGVLSKEYLEAHGTKNIKPTTKEVRNAKYVWKEDFGSNYDISRSK